MRPTKELKQALEQLSLQADSLERQAQIEVIRNCHSEKKVFELYVLKAEVKNESVFYAARDAAQFVAGKLELETLLGMDVLPVGNKPEPEEEKVTVSKAYLEELERRIERLEKSVMGITDSVHLRQKRMDGKELIPQAEACKYVGCDQRTLCRWVNKGIIHREKWGRKIFFYKEELDSLPTVQAYKNRKIQ